MNDIVSPVRFGDIAHNCQVKEYPDGSHKFMVASRPIFRESGWESSVQSVKYSNNSGSDIERSKRRARSKIFDYAMSNLDLRYFVTFTLDGSLVDRYDIKTMTKRLNTWLDNRVRRSGLKYILVPELHKDGAIHYHGFINDALSVVDSGTMSNGGRPIRPRSEAHRAALVEAGWHTVYNVKDWPYGFTTAIELYGERSKAVSYVCKYVSKALDKIGGRWYYSGGKLALPVVTLYDVDYDECIDGHEEWPLSALNCCCASWMEVFEDGS